LLQDTIWWVELTKSGRISTSNTRGLAMERETMSPFTVTRGRLKATMAAVSVGLGGGSGETGDGA
jgi:hypothetical protein